MIKHIFSIFCLTTVLSLLPLHASCDQSCDSACSVDGYDCESVDCIDCQERGLDGKGYDSATHTYLWDNGTVGSTLTLAGEPSLINGCKNPRAGKDFKQAIAAQKFNTCHAGKSSDEITSVQIAFMDITDWAYALFGVPGEQDLDQQFAEINPIDFQVKVKIWDGVPLATHTRVIACQEYTIQCEDLGNEIGSNIRPLNSKCQAIFNVADGSSSSCQDESCDTCNCNPSSPCDIPHPCALPHTRRVDNSTSCPVGPNFYKQGSGFSVYPARFTTICFEHPVRVTGEFYVGIEVTLPGSGNPTIENDLDIIGISVIDATDCKKFGGASFSNNTPATISAANPVIFNNSSASSIAGVDLQTSLDEVLAIRANAMCDETSLSYCPNKQQ
jgi:hypothetical protein